MRASRSSSRVLDWLPKPDVRGARSAYTLLELLLVLAILIMVAGAVAPSVVGMMADHRLKETTEAVRNALARTRIHAIDTGSVYQFRIEPRGRHFIAVPTDPAALPNSGSSLPPSAVEVGQLDEGFSFEVVAAAPTASSAVPMTLAASDPAFSAMVGKTSLSQDFGVSNWSAPIVFQPDGRAIDASFNIVDEHGDGFRIRVRELTGEVFVERRGQ
jgi:type II secretory pathway pseudopilin PulG